MTLRAIALTCLVVSALVVCCADDGPPEAVDAFRVVDWAVEQHLGEADPAQVVATVADELITAADVSLCLQHRPTNTVRACVDALVDTAVLLQEARDGDRGHPTVSDVRSSALAEAFLRDNVVRAVNEDSLTDAEMRQFRTDPGTRVYIDMPELRRSSHLRTWGEDDAAAELLAREIYDQTDWTEVTTAHLLGEVAAAARPRAQELGASVAAESLPFTGPFFDGPTHGAVMVMVEPFARALYELEAIGDISGPVQSQFGWHIILLEEVREPTALEPDDAHAVVVGELLARARARTINELIQRASERHNVHWIPENIGFLGSQYDNVLRSQSEALRESINPDE